MGSSKGKEVKGGKTKRRVGTWVGTVVKQARHAGRYGVVSRPGGWYNRWVGRYFKKEEKV